MTFAEAYDQYFEMIYRYLWKRIPLSEDVKDVAAIIWQAAWQSWPRLKKMDNCQKQEVVIQKWLWGITHHKLNDFWRQKYREPLISDTDDLDKLIDIPYQAEENRTDKPTKPQKIIIKIVETLPAQDQKLVELKYQRKCSYSQIAAELNITKNNAKVRHNRLLKKIRKKWQKEINKQ